ncbi:putative membrane protein [Synechococcus sp. BMK-MC-1]|nr:putative membrane protein [Synechococcus sp. BMK-MC-1]
MQKLIFFERILLIRVFWTLFFGGTLVNLGCSCRALKNL